MSVGAGRTQWAVALAVGFANGHIAGETKAEAFAEEGSKGEVIVCRVSCGLRGEHALGGAMDIGHVGYSFKGGENETIRSCDTYGAAACGRESIGLKVVR